MEKDFTVEIKHSTHSELERRARVVLPDLLAHVPGISIKTVDFETSARLITAPENGAIRGRGYQPDLEILVTHSGDSQPVAHTAGWRLFVEVTGHVDTRRLQTIAAYVDGITGAVPVLFVRQLSTETLEKCRRYGVCCADAAGNGWIMLGDRVYIERIGGKADATLGKGHSVPPLSAPKTENILRVLLNALGAARQVWRLHQLADEAGVSQSQAGRVKSILSELGMTEEVSGKRRVGGFRLAHPEETLEEWAGYVRARNYRAGAEHTFYAIDDPLELQRMLTRKLPSFVAKHFALAGEQAADVYASYARSPIFAAYVLPDAEIDLDSIEEAMDLDQVTSGVNVVLTVPRDPGVFYLPPDLRESARDARLRERRTPVVSPVQAYLDLQRSGGRAREGAKYLLEQYLRPRWQMDIRDNE